MIKISVIIPCWNQEELVIRAINSIPKRDDIEIIVIEDGSTDNTWKNLFLYKKFQRENMILLKNNSNKGVGYTVNKGLDIAAGEYVVLLGSDDYFYTEEFIKALDELDGTDLVYFNVKVNNGDIWELNQDSKHVLVGSFKFMRNAFIANTRCDESRKSGEDISFYKELLSKKPTEKFITNVVKHYNHPREGSLTDLVRKGIINE